MESSSAIRKGSESIGSIIPSQKFPSPPKQKKDYYLDSNTLSFERRNDSANHCTFVTEGKGDKLDVSDAGKSQEAVIYRKPKKLSGFNNAGYINDTYDEINGLLDEFNDKIRNVVDSNQDVFISAYRDSMNRVNSELKEMKYKMSADKIKEKQEQKLKLVEKERDWFRDEALRLNRKWKKLEEEIKRIKSYYNSRK